MHRLSLFALVGLLATLGCSSVPEFTVGLDTTPVAPIPEKPITARVTLTGASTAGVSVSLRVAGATVKAAEDANNAGQYITHELVLPTAGAHTVEILVTVDGDTEIWEAGLVASCEQGGAAGSPCCGPNTCGNGLLCVYGACSTNAAADGGRCHEGGECASGVCKEGQCQAPACDDGVKNGEELGTDCGTLCGVGCPSGTPCVVNKDCDTGFCAMGRCPAKAGELIGSIEDTTASPTVTPILSQSMTAPNDLAFSTLDENQLWVVDMAKDSFVVIYGAGQDGQTHQVILDKSQHFMERVTSISFADEPTFGTCGDTRNDYGGLAKPNNFMGPVQWPSDVNDYKGKSSAHQVHWDMLHSSPYCMGMASAGGTTYFAFNGFNNSIDWYDFKQPHCPGCDDHSDGVKRRFDGVNVKRVAGVPSNLEYDFGTKLLYVADTGNGRVLRLDANQSQAVKPIQSFPGDGKLTLFSKPVVEELNATGLTRPSGLALDRNVLYVGDYATGIIRAYDVSEPGANGTFGKLLREFDTKAGPNAIVGMTVGPDLRLYVVDRGGRRVIRIDP